MKAVTLNYTEFHGGEWISIGEYIASEGASFGAVLMVDGAVVIGAPIHKGISSGKISLTVMKIESGSMADGNIEISDTPTTLYRDSDTMAVVYKKRLK